MNTPKVKIINPTPTVEMLRAQAGNCSCDGCAARRWAADEIERLTLENWQLRQACGYPIPADKETVNNPFKCGACDARRNNPE